MKVAIVGHTADKFDDREQRVAKNIIRQLLTQNDILISGHSPLGGIDIWTEEIADDMGIDKKIFEPKINQWNPEGYGYKRRNLDIAKHCDVIHVIVVQQYPENFIGEKVLNRDGKPTCYHCNKDGHVKSGGCWTAWEAKRLAKLATWHVIPPYGLPMMGEI